MHNGNGNGKLSRHALIAIVSHRPPIDFRVFDCIDTATPNLHTMGVFASRVVMCGNADLAAARNILAATAFVGDFSELVFIDSDVTWEPGCLERLMSHPVDLVAGCYPGRGEPIKFPVWPIASSGRRTVNPTTGAFDPDGLIEVAGAPTGFMRITRRCLDQMINAYSEELWYKEPRMENGRAWNLFQFATMPDRRRVTEDYFFCDLYRKISGKVWVDPWLHMHHHGDKAYSGMLADYFAAEDARQIEMQLNTECGND